MPMTLCDIHYIATPRLLRYCHYYCCHHCYCKRRHPLQAKRRSHRVQVWKTCKCAGVYVWKFASCGHFQVCSATVRECKRLDVEVGDKMCITLHSIWTKLPPAGLHLNASRLESVLVKQCFTPLWRRQVKFQAFALVTCELRLIVQPMCDRL